MKQDAQKRIETVSQLVKAFGGTVALAKWAGVTPSVVSNWKERGHIPTGWHLRLYLECKQRKLNVSPALFGLVGKGNGKTPLPSAGLNGPRLVAAN